MKQSSCGKIGNPEKFISQFLFGNVLKIYFNYMYKRKNTQNLRSNIFVHVLFDECRAYE